MPSNRSMRLVLQMAYRLDITDQAHNDLAEIVHYIAQQLKNPAAAISLRNQIRGVYQNLMAHPEMYPFAKASRVAAKEIRIAPVENYVIAYVVDHGNQRVVIRDVFYGARDYLNLL